MKGTSSSIKIRVLKHCLCWIFHLSPFLFFNTSRDRPSVRGGCRGGDLNSTHYFTTAPAGQYEFLSLSLDCVNITIFLKMGMSNKLLIWDKRSSFTHISGKHKRSQQRNMEKLSTSLTVARAAMTQAAETLATRVPKGTHFNKPDFPKPRPLSRARNHLVHTPSGATKQANHNWASLPPLSNSLFNKAPLTPHNRPSINNSMIITTKWRLKLATFQLLVEVRSKFGPSLLRIHLKPSAVSTPKMMEYAARIKPVNNLEVSKSLSYS